jgi:hypothetical protein
LSKTEKALAQRIQFVTLLKLTGLDVYTDASVTLERA